MQLPRLAPGSRKAKGRISGKENVRHGEVVVTQVSLNHRYPGGNPGEEMSLFFSLDSYFLLAACWQARTKHETVCLYLENLPGPGPAQVATFLEAGLLSRAHLRQQGRTETALYCPAAAEAARGHAAAGGGEAAAVDTRR